MLVLHQDDGGTITRFRVLSVYPSGELTIRTLDGRLARARATPAALLAFREVLESERFKTAVEFVSGMSFASWDVASLELDANGRKITVPLGRSPEYLAEIMGSVDSLFGAAFGPRYAPLLEWTP